MGTSGEYSGPGQGTPLLPPWADEGEPEGEGPGESGEEPTEKKPPTDVTIDLRGARRYLRQYAATGDSQSLARASRGYVRGLGGAGGAAVSARGGRRAARNLGGVLSRMAGEGVPAALDWLDEDEEHLLGRPVEEVLVELQDFVAPDGASIDDAAARSAMATTLGELYEEYGLGNAGLQGLSEMDVDGVRWALECFVTNYIYERMLNAMHQDLDDTDLDIQGLVRAERAIKDFTRKTVKLELDDVDVLSVEWDGREGEAVTTRVFEQAYRVWEAMRL